MSLCLIIFCMHFSISNSSKMHVEYLSLFVKYSPKLKLAYVITN